MHAGSVNQGHRLSISLLKYAGRSQSVVRAGAGANGDRERGNEGGGEHVIVSVRVRGPAVHFHRSRGGAAATNLPMGMKYEPRLSGRGRGHKKLGLGCRQGQSVVNRNNGVTRCGLTKK